MIHKKAGLFSSKPATLVNMDRHLTGINTRNPVDTGRVARMSGSQGVPHTSVLRVGLLTAFESSGVRSSVSDSYDLLPWAGGPEIASPHFLLAGVPHTSVLRVGLLTLLLNSPTSIRQSAKSIDTNPISPLS
jgi:hypothetical protein